MNTRKAAANAAIFAPAAKNAPIVIGAPSKASGIHMWKGTTAIFTPNPTIKRTIARMPNGRTSGPAVERELAMAVSPVEPVTPKTREMA